MSNDAVKLGKLALADAERDAVHVAIVPAIANCNLTPGERVGIFHRDGNLIADTNYDYVGVVDPFLLHKVFAGQTFYVCLFPNTVTDMRHHWTHPAFGDE